MATRGKWPTVLNHPAHFTPICATEFVAFANRFEEFKKLDHEFLGSSR
ncbi:MAG: redoxin domain-containing protein [Candidatus Bathyarchaeia archaeon]